MDEYKIEHEFSFLLLLMQSNGFILKTSIFDNL